jgi:ABC-type multidrug transport system fused ATPase/permease subunit
MSQAIQRPRISHSSGTGLFRRALQLVPARGTTLLSLAVGVGLTGVGHGALALAAGMLGQSLTKPGGADVRGMSLREIAYFGLGAALVKAMGSILLAFSESRASGGVVGELRKRLLRRVAKSGLPDARLRALAVISVRTRELETAVAQGAIGGVRAVAQLAPIMAGLILVSPPLAFVGSVLLLPFALCIAAMRRRWRRSAEQAQGLAEALHAGVDELLCNLDLWRTYGATARVEDSVERANAQAVRTTARVDAARAALSGGNEVLGALALVGVISLANRAGVGLGDGTLVAFAAMCFMAYRPLRDLGDARAWSARGAAALDALESISVDVASPVAHESTELPPRARLVASDLGARGRGPRSSFALEPGEVLALVGPTGSGKTTLLRVLLGLEPSTGSLDYGDASLEGLPVGPDSRPFAWVPQDAPLVTGTILENVALACGDESRARLALAELGATRLLERAGDVVGPGGRPLSGGERRLVSMARALATGSPVLLLDEPTAGLDAEARARVMAALRKLAGRRSMIIATHEADLAGIADRVVDVGPAVDLAAE